MPTSRVHSPAHRAIGTSQARQRNVLDHQSSNTTRVKHSMDHLDHDFDAIKPKRAKFSTIAVEIPSKLAPHSRAPIKNLSATSRHLESTDALHTAIPASTTEPPQPPPPRLVVTKNQLKVANGLKYELSRLQADNAQTKETGRKLRSQEAIKFKSELSAYFTDYDEVIGNEPKEKHLLNLDTPFFVVDTKSSDQPPLGVPRRDGNQIGRFHATSTVRGYSDTSIFNLFESQAIDFGFLVSHNSSHKITEDPLPDSVYTPAHRKAERSERSVRNAEKARAQHEKDQIVRLLEKLQGHDWLKAMGVSGITESKKKTFEPAREHFITGCQAILEKFHKYTEEEKRLKVEKDRVLAEAESRYELNKQEAGGEQMTEVSRDSQDEDVCWVEDDFDKSITKQLRQEAMAAAQTKDRRSNSKPPSPTKVQTFKSAPSKPFMSFFEKRYQRDAALSKARRRGRTVLAWGQPLPEPPEKDFNLPEEYRDEQTLKARERRRRRVRRNTDE